jgi:hypothetical protein
MRSFFSEPIGFYHVKYLITDERKFKGNSEKKSNYRLDILPYDGFCLWARRLSLFSGRENL